MRTLIKQKNVDRLQKAFDIVRMTYFPRWDKENKWIVKLNPELKVTGLFEADTKKIHIKSLDRLDLHLLLVHEICHSVSPDHGKKWQGRMLKAAKKAKNLGDNDLADKIIKNVDDYINTPYIFSARAIYNKIEDLVIATNGNKAFDDIMDFIKDDWKVCDEKIDKLKKCKDVYEKTIKLINFEKNLREKHKVE